MERVSKGAGSAAVDARLWILGVCTERICLGASAAKCAQVRGMTMSEIENQNALFVATDLDIITDPVITSEHKQNDIQKAGKNYRRLDPSYYAWLRHKMEKAKAAHEAGQITAEAYDRLRARFNTVHLWAVENLGADNLKVAYQEFDVTDYHPPPPLPPSAIPPKNDTGTISSAELQRQDMLKRLKAVAEDRARAKAVEAASPVARERLTSCSYRGESYVVEVVEAIFRLPASSLEKIDSILAQDEPIRNLMLGHVLLGYVFEFPTYPGIEIHLAVVNTEVRPVLNIFLLECGKQVARVSLNHRFPRTLTLPYSKQREFRFTLVGN